VYDPRVGEHLREAKQRVAELKATLEQVANRRVDIEQRK
jgi:hypothetical protein